MSATRSGSFVEAQKDNKRFMKFDLERFNNLDKSQLPPPVVMLQMIQGFWQSRGLSERCEVVAGDFFTSVPRGDTYVLKWMIHDWDDQRSAALLKNCRSAMSKEEEKMKTPLVVALVGLAISFALPTLLLRH
jgi:hypothetical protein